MKKILVPILLGILAVSFASVGFAFATDDGQSTTSTSPTTTQRHINVVELPNGVLVRSDYSSGTVENHFGVALTTDTPRHVGVMIRVAFSHDSEIGDSE